jgi:hypothetical protein
LQKEELEKLIEGKPDDIKGKGILLFNAYLKTQISVKDDPSSQNYRNMNSAQEALEKFRISQGGEKSDEKYSTEKSILKYLSDNGWKTSKATLNRHIKIERKLLRQVDGTFTQKSIDKYAETWLKKTATGKRLQEGLDELQRQKLEAELKNLTLKNDRETFNYEKDRSLYIPREQMEIELATRAGILIAGLKHWVQTNVSDWIELSGGDTRKVGELINKMSNDIDEHLNLYASHREYEIVIDSEPVDHENNPRERSPERSDSVEEIL